MLSFPTQPMLPVALMLTFVIGGSSTSCRSNKSEVFEVAESTPFGDKKTSENVAAAVSNARQKTYTNPNLNIPVDPSRARAVTYSQVNVNAPVLAMTFDDGPHPTLTPKLLDLLKDRNIKATFFVLADRVKRHPDIIQRMIAEGHEVANHTVTHGNLAKMSNEGIRKELEGCHSAIVSSGGVAPRVMRPPYGALGNSQRVWVHEQFNYPTILWSCDPEDWKRPGVSVVTQRLISGAKNGAILLAHDIHAPTIAAMPQTLDGILAKGYQFVTVSQLISMEQKAPATLASGAPIEVDELSEAALPSEQGAMEKLIDFEIRQATPLKKADGKPSTAFQP